MSTRLLAGRYELIEKIGEGGMAIVYKARCRLLNRYVAIKILRRAVYRKFQARVAGSGSLDAPEHCERL